uniref:Uncharacterized protein n=1 Tax=Spongospora subterranea TaxID=70186 RepID=A0A0H5QRY2_9EUKA|eukprot:CRZ04296.1 hypothetical protein [Spongospora subterranea]
MSRRIQPMLYKNSNPRCVQRITLLVFPILYNTKKTSQMINKSNLQFFIIYQEILEGKLVHGLKLGGSKYLIINFVLINSFKIKPHLGFTKLHEEVPSNGENSEQGTDYIHGAMSNKHNINQKTRWNEAHHQQSWH